MYSIVYNSLKKIYFLMNICIIYIIIVCKKISYLYKKSIFWKNFFNNNVNVMLTQLLLLLVEFFEIYNSFKEK